MIDVGAAEGDWTLLVSRYHKAKKVLAIEPSKLAYDHLIRNIKLNKVKNVIPVLAAASDKKGYTKLYLENFSLSNLNTNKNEVKVKTDTLDNMCKIHKLAYVSLIKIDVEGSELKVLKGSSRILKTYKPRIIVETHSKNLKNEVINFLKRFDYKPIFIDDWMKKKGNLLSVIYFK
ncbi:MAG: FkbM family methyltransferase [Candidatus Aenigmatarchaeota archaeon]